MTMLETNSVGVRESMLMTDRITLIRIRRTVVSADKEVVGD